MESEEKQETPQLCEIAEKNRQSLARMQLEITRLKIRLALTGQDDERTDRTNQAA